MNFKELKELVALVSESAIKEFKYKDQELEIRIRTDKDTDAPIISTSSVPAAIPTTTQVIPAASTVEVAPVAAQATSAGSAGDAESSDANLLEIKSPMVGTFYRSSGPEKAAFVQVGDEVSNGSVVCIIEAMKLFNEIESEVAGKIVKVVVDDASPVEYDQVLFLVDPNA